MDYSQRINRWIEQNQTTIISFLQDLIRVPSVTGEEGPIQQFIAGQLQEMGLEVDVFEPSLDTLRKHPAFVEVSRGFEGRPNVVGILKGTGGGKSLLFNGHVDVIPAGATESWQHGSWSGDIAEGRLYGRGASDMKSGLAAMTMAVKAILESGIRLKGDIILEYTVDEELSGNGTLACVIKGYQADGGICCETSSMRVQPGSIGRIWFEIKVQGMAAGIQRRWEGVNAIEKGYLVTQAVADFERIRVKRLSHPLYPDILGAIPCMVGVFESGSYHSAFPDSCLLKGSMATVPGEDSSAVKAEFVEFIREKVAGDPWLKEHPPEVIFTGYFAEPSEIPVDSAIVRTLNRNFIKVMGKEPVITGREGAADIRFMNKYGNTPTVIFGPGLTEQMHANNEWVNIEDLIQSTKILAHTILEWCQAD
ncbi:acetylornithine deacetylase [Desulfotomaculum arcticum]|uniref:Acetylornithine deacetylase n=1 Tax=Desulfotruncus arcticus DSM 17038 TaxID=1121424 RepID=A0A1I2S7J6_9FIRM|nr:ArgE/DapE family deacylase [Desulfotruncus arcticus]SFG47689.1 acetylornithine deacetylase [Desulfotomaculum arcticum] [Desulfotruncus arcticus DSM 17038]